MNITEVKKVVPILLKHRVVPFLWGMQGVGKTQVVRQIGKELGFDGVILLNLATQEVGDLIGLLKHNEDGTVSHSRPNWFPITGRYLIFLDEFNRAHPDVLQPMYNFILEGKLHTHQLGPDCRIVTAGNFQSNMFNVTDTSDAALISRFCHIDFNPTPEEFVMFAEESKAFGVADFIRRHPEMLEVKVKDRLDGNMVTPNRRAWLDIIAKLDDEAGMEEERFEVYKGIVGGTAAAAYLTDRAKSGERLSGRRILNEYDKMRKQVLELSSKDSVRFDLLNTAVEEIFLMKDEFTTDQIKNFMKFFLDIPLEMALKVKEKLSKSTFAWKNKLLNNPEFVKEFAARKL